MLDKLRKEIDELDDIIIDSLNKRYQVVEKINEYKKSHELPVFDANREDAIIQKIVEKKLNYRLEITEIYHLILKLSKDLQE